VDTDDVSPIRTSSRTPTAGLVGNLPSWTQPPSPRRDPTSPEDTDLDPELAGPVPSGAGGGRPDHRPAGTGRTGTRTRTSTSGDDQVDTAKLVAAGLALSAALAAWAVRSLARRRLRRPSDEQVRDIARPLARLATRFWDEARVDGALLDVIEAGAATALYLEDGPLLTRELDVDPGVPAHLQDEETPA